MSQLNLPCQRWREHRSSYRVPGEVIRPRDYEVAPITFAEAKAFVVAHHYSRSYPSCRFRYGLFTRVALASSLAGFAPELVGVAVFSVPQHRNVLTNVFPGDVNDSVELGRFVLLDHVPANAESWFIERCNVLLKTEAKLTGGVVAFSDDIPRRVNGKVLFPGHIGNIYQATSATFIGRGASKTLFLFPDGSTFERRAQSKIRNAETGREYAKAILMKYGADEPGRDLKAWLEHWLPLLTTRVRHPGNLKYAWRLNRRTTIAVSARPYPKRGRPHERLLLQNELASG